MKTEINWWELDKNEIFLIEENYCDFILNQVRLKYKNLNTLRLKLNMGREVYHSLKSKTQGINNFHLQKILHSTGLDFSDISTKFIGVGKYKTANLIFPIKLSPYWSCLLAHSFFDGYADNYIMRYANYDVCNRKEFTTLIQKIFGGGLVFNNPKNPRRDIDLPAIVPRLLVKFFNVNTFYSDRCRIPKELFDLARLEHAYGYYFLKGAYIDEGSISGGQIWIVRGIKNKPLAEDITKLCRILNIRCRLKFSNKTLNGYSVGVKKESFDDFFDSIKTLFWNKNTKLLKLEDTITRHRLPLKRDSLGRFMERELKCQAN